MKPKCPDCGAELVKDHETIADWYCNFCDMTFDVEELDWSLSEDDEADE